MKYPFTKKKIKKGLILCKNRHLKYISKRIQSFELCTLQLVTTCVVFVVYSTAGYNMCGVLGCKSFIDDQFEGGTYSDCRKISLDANTYRDSDFE